MKLADYITQKKDQHILLLSIFEIESVHEEEEHILLLLDYFNNLRQKKMHEELIYFFQLLINISKNHHRTPNFNAKVSRIIIKFEPIIKKLFSNEEIFNIFEEDRLILLILIKNKTIIIDQNIAISIYLNHKHRFLFEPEINKFLNNYEKQIIIKEKSLFDPEIFTNFNEKRQTCENDSYICSLIRNDSIEEFVSYTNQANIQLSSNIIRSIYETNTYLLEQESTSLIEYAAFFGSVQIFQYLIYNNVEMTPSLWMYAIHGNNPIIIHILEDNKIIPNDDSYEECLFESIKCHHNNISNYIHDNLLSQKKANDPDFQNYYLEKAIFHNNYALFADDFDKKAAFIYFCMYNKSSIVNLYLKRKKNKIKEKLKKKDMIEYQLLLQRALKKNDLDIIYYMLKNKETIDASYFKDNQAIKAIAIPPSVEIISNFAFKYCVSLTEISFPSSLKEIGNYAFYKCYSLRKAILPSSLIKIGMYSFCGCKSLKELLFESPSSLVEIGQRSFSYCTSLKKVIIPSSVQCLGNYSFMNCSSLEYVEVLTSLQHKEEGGYMAFMECKSLKKIKYV